MAIQSIFSSQVNQISNLPQRALYAQVQSFTSGLTRSITNPKPGKLTKRRIAIEVLWFFCALVVSLLLGLLIFYLIGFYIPDSFISLVTLLGTIDKLYYTIVIISLISIYLVRLIVWAIKTVTLD